MGYFCELGWVHTKNTKKTMRTPREYKKVRKLMFVCKILYEICKMRTDNGHFHANNRLFKHNLREI